MTMTGSKKICTAIQITLLILFVLLLVMNYAGYWSYDSIRYYIYAIVVLAVINTIVILFLDRNTAPEQQLSQRTRRTILLTTTILGIAMVALALFIIFI
jgi:FlaA1/EpsC-like NDP-sugar epimerase